MWRIRKYAKAIPWARFVYDQVVRLTLKNKSADAIFSEIFSGNKWGGNVSVSGLGSDLNQTKIVAGELPLLCREINVGSILDIPCGDFYWMKNVNLSGIEYLGADIVADLIGNNTKQYEKQNIRFETLDLMTDCLPTVDLIFCRDCLVHFSNDDVILALKNICKSESSYLMTTTFGDRRSNRNIATGQWRPLNLECVPAMLPPPIRLIVENCTENGGAYRDKSMGLWKISEIKTSLQRAGYEI